jgi:hypothetical protein
MIREVAHAGSRFDESDAQDVAFGLQLRDALELNLELAALRRRELFQVLDSTLQRSQAAGVNGSRFRTGHLLQVLTRLVQSR